MKPFNDPELNKGFQLDTSLLTHEQLEHVLKIFQARGIATEYYDKRRWILFDANAHHTRQLLGYEEAQILSTTQRYIAKVIDYPTLCRGAVQLEVGNWCIANMEQCKKITGYSSIDVSVTQNDTSLFVGYHWQGGHSLKLSPEDFEDKLRGIYPVVKKSLTTEEYLQQGLDKHGFEFEDTTEQPKPTTEQIASYIVDLIAKNVELEQENAQLREQKNKVSADWFDLTVKRAELEQRIAELEAKLAQNAELKETVAECGEKTLMDNPTIADHIGSHINLAFEYAKELVNENTRLEQENAELKERIAELEAKLSQNAEPVYDAEWLANLVNNYDDIYWLDGANLTVGGITMSGKDSAPIIIAALAKHLNGDWVGKGNYWSLYYDLVHEKYMATEYEATYEFGQPKFKTQQAAQKAIDVLSQIAPEVLKNYLV